MSKSNLFSEFNDVSTQQWKQKIQFDLKGKDYNECVVWESLEGIKVKPFYNSEDTCIKNAIPTPLKPWSITQAIYAGHEEIANKKAIKALQKGAESILFTIPNEKVSIALLLKNIDPQQIVFYFDFQFISATYSTIANEFLSSVDAKFYFNVDIIHHLTTSGNWHTNSEEDFLQFDAVAANTNTLTLDATNYQNAGANLVQQLAYSLAHANEYLNRIPEANISSFSINFKIAIGSNYFFEIAKIRALRLLYKTLAAAYGAPENCHILAVTTKRNKTLYDYNSNMLRSTTECMSAVLGGADAVCNLPYDAIYHKSNDFAERIARNQLIILKEESYFDKTNNPADGSYYIESLTKQLADKALELFKELEKGGGFLSQLKANTIQKKIKESAQKEQDLFDCKKLILVGTNKYESSLDKMKGDLELFPFAKNKPRKSSIEPIIERRLSEALELKRLENE
ncbi:methylmalonyl-CoA mutase subunit beta [Cellulophaga sp. E16_2]|uniref:methylmalonyl-CoA mutase subunit beta n=1 Tax=Cellulophaga sp. E16_2 TaxID=2789297 RepID=UPI001A9306E0|nr:methylmalonyl-CoA mutase subunit beta [Cellulophaga sp. E16_2]MBO0592436.1 methylmalonyl-CoA mutase subunit beta [Cellulophaga sp. E16_2]